jgi:[glutamine synthetase] adenylyltransferase / [glutamine synthetase]-adenylyl-L-tyrosine phosphorylase
VIESALTRAHNNSPFLAQLIERQPELVRIFETGDFDAAMTAALAVEAETLGPALRKRRQGVALVTAIADLSGTWDLTKVTHTLSDFADNALDTAIAAAIEERVPGAPNEGFAVIALGKHGGRELNYSSDIDPIFLFDPKTLPRREGEEPQESAIRIGKKIIELLHNVDENGYVFRVDMRLRPSPEISPIALPVEAAIGYYESSALAWEQAAFIRSRAAAGDKRLGAYFLDSIKPFIWRRSLDFGQIRNIRSMSAQIRDHYSRGQAFGLGYDLKRGRGGIRECEFFAQVHQLIHGGRDDKLRVADTRAALAALAGAGWISANEAAIVSGHYERLRVIEHRLQMIDDRQTHNLPASAEDCDRVARLDGLENGKALLAELAPDVQEIRTIYDGLVGDEDETAARLADEGLPLEEQLSDMGFSDPAGISQRIGRWRSGKLRAIRSEAAKDAFEAVLPSILEVLGRSADPANAIARFDNLIEALPSAVNFFLLLEARPALLQLIGGILCYAPVLAEALGRRAEYLDGLIDATALELPGSADEIAQELRAHTADLDYQNLLDQVRAFVGEKRFALGVQLTEGHSAPDQVGRGYAHLAEAALQVLSQATVAEFEAAHGRVKGGELVILGLGRLGGETLTHASDLDIVMLFTGSFEAQSDGAKPLVATQYFNRLAQRVVAALSVPTASGALYEIDTRLRPSGAQGLLCVSLDSFARYQREDAWVWEHMALTRARPIFGSAKAKSTAQKIIDDVLAAPRDKAETLAAIAKMRGEMAAHKPPAGPLDVKLLPGGLVDAEFVIHALQLTGAAKAVPQLDQAAEALQAAGALPAEFGAAQALLSRLLILLRLIAPDCAIPPEPAQQRIANCMAQQDWTELSCAVVNARDIVLKEYQKLLGAYDSN